MLFTMYCATQGHTQMGIPFVYAPYGGVSEHYTAIVSRVRRLCVNGRP